MCVLMVDLRCKAGNQHNIVNNHSPILRKTNKNFLFNSIFYFVSCFHVYYSLAFDNSPRSRKRNIILILLKISCKIPKQTTSSYRQ